VGQDSGDNRIGWGFKQGVTWVLKWEGSLFVQYRPFKSNFSSTQLFKNIFKPLNSTYVKTGQRQA